MKLQGCLTKIILGLVGGYLLLLTLMYFNQEKLIFHANPLPQDFVFKTEVPYEEIHLKTQDQTNLSGLLFRVPNPKGLIFYLHGNSGNAQGWSQIAPIYTALGYDLFLLDYRGFGKSTGEVVSQKQVYADAQLAYDYFKQKYSENHIIIAGYSIGTGIATWLAKENHPKKLMLQAPYYNLKEMTRYRFPFVPTFLLKYEFDNQEYIKNVSCEIAIYHGVDDKVIPVEQARLLRKNLKIDDIYTEIPNQGHGNFNQNLTFQKHLIGFLIH